MTYKVGDQVWYASFSQREERVPCPVCFGNKQVIVVLGNGEEVQVGCQYCELGWEGSKGWVTEYQRLPKAELRTITKIRIEEDLGTKKFEYQSQHYTLNPDQMFDNEEDALICAKEMEEEFNQKKLDKPKYKNEKSYTWNAGYHLREAKSKFREAQYHEEKAKICKSKSKIKDEQDNS